MSGILSSQPEVLLDGFSFAEGPAVNESGTLYFTDIPNARIYSYHDDILEVFLENSGGANGLYFDHEGNLIACAGRARQLIKINKEGEVEVLADEYNGKKLNSPNDLWIDPEGGIYFTDPRYGNTDNMEQDGMHVYYLNTDGELLRVTEDLVRPNGIIGTSDGNELFIVDQGIERTYRYKIKKNGELKGKKLFVEVGTDGMSINNEGNIYITNGKNIDIYNQKAFLVNSYSFPAFTTNVVHHNGMLYVTTQAGQVFIVRE
jgi:gluconolactonase